MNRTCRRKHQSFWKSKDLDEYGYRRIIVCTKCGGSETVYKVGAGERAT